MIIDCGTCSVAGLACGDCVVSVLLGMPELIQPPGDGMHDMPEIAAMPVVHVEDEHAAALEVLAGSGLVPPLRLVPRSRAS
jgi:hypothetical protein